LIILPKSSREQRMAALLRYATTSTPSTEHVFVCPGVDAKIQENYGNRDILDVQICT